VGEKRNACVSLCRGDVIFPWDDDDISLPWRISLSLKHKGDKRYFKSTSAWLWQNGKIGDKPRKNIYHAMGCWDNSLFQEVDGYPHIQSGQDCEIEKRFDKTGERKVTRLSDNEIYYIYKFGGTGHVHLSAHGWNKGWIEMGKEKPMLMGEIKLNPHWKQNYLFLVSNCG
jgi:hypothetical protein